ncbi:MAG TPA: TetR family transcriptional regulator [Roseiarcus sp.]|nr:TetR family transcriptional regulator [Roseiarcus sp.]
MAKNSQSASASPKSESADARARIIEALLALAAEQPFEDISISAIAAKAGVTLADFRDAFPSKGAVLAGFSRRIDRLVLEKQGDELAGEETKDRLFDVLMRRLDAMAPYKEGLRGVARWLRREPLAAVAVNQVVVNSMRFMLEAAGVDSEGAVGALKLQGLAMAWARVLDVWFDDDEPDQAKTMAALDRELTRGGRIVARAESLDRLAAPLKALGRAMFEMRRGARGAYRDGGRRSRDDERAHRL